MKITVYQIAAEEDNRYLIFQNLESVLAACGNRVPAERYAEVYQGELEIRTLEEVFYLFNMAHPEGYRGRSMSVSDVVEISDPEKGEDFYFCDTFGFRQVTFEKDRCIGRDARKG